MKPLLLAVLGAALAGPALAQVKVEYPIKFDFTVRPKLFPHPVRAARDAAKPMTVKEAKALAEDLFAAYQNIGALTRFRFHQRTKDEAPMTADELGWVETELKDEMAHAEKLAPEAETALKIGIERPAPYPDGYKSPLGKKLRMRLRASAAWSKGYTPTYEDHRKFEHYAMGGIMDNLHSLVDEASDRVEDPAEEAKFVAQIQKDLAKDYASLEASRKGMLNAAKEAEGQSKDEPSKSEAARGRAQRAISTGPKGGSTAKGAGAVLEDRAAKEAAKDGNAAGVRDSGERITPEEAVRRAMAAEVRSTAPRKGRRSPAIVPAP